MAEQSNYGGQAVMEGVMMRGRQDMAVAVRTPAGEIAVFHQRLEPGTWVRRLRPMPLLRGVFLLWDTMLLGMRALVFSANIGLVDDTDGGTAAESEGGPLSGAALWGTVAVSILFSVGLFFVAPLAVVGVLDRHIHSSILSNLIEGGIRLGILLGYLAALGQLRDIRRVFGYHGAEHKTINAWEAGDPLDVPHVRAHSVSHPRCGTGFLLVVVLLSVLVFAFLGRPPFPLRVLSRIVLVPLIAALAYEFIKWTAAHLGNPLVRALIAPSLALQRLTTREPDDGMLEAAIASFKRVLVAEGQLEPAQFFVAGVVAVDEAGRALQPAAVPAQP